MEMVRFRKRTLDSAQQEKNIQNGTICIKSLISNNVPFPFKKTNKVWNQISVPGATLRNFVCCVLSERSQEFHNATGVERNSMMQKLEGQAEDTLSSWDASMAVRLLHKIAAWLTRPRQKASQAAWRKHFDCRICCVYKPKDTQIDLKHFLKILIPQISTQVFNLLIS